MPTRHPYNEQEPIKIEFWPEGLTSEPVPARVVSLAPGVLCLVTQAPPIPGARFVAKFSIPGEFPIVAGCRARWRVQRAPLEFWVSATFLTLDGRDRDTLYEAWQRHLSARETQPAADRGLAAAGT